MRVSRKEEFQRENVAMNRNFYCPLFTNTIDLNKVQLISGNQRNQLFFTLNLRPTFQLKLNKTNNTIDFQQFFYCNLTPHKMFKNEKESKLFQSISFISFVQIIATISNEKRKKIIFIPQHFSLSSSSLETFCFIFNVRRVEW